MKNKRRQTALTDSAAFTDSAVQAKSTALTDSAAFTDSAVQAKSTALAEPAAFTDSAVQAKSTALTDSAVQTYSAALTQTSGQDEAFMRSALALADEAAALGEVPVGAVVVKDGEIIAGAYNRRETDKNALAHAELLAIDSACRKLGGWRLHQCELYVTLEPCPMCAGAIVNARIRRVVIGARDSKAGALGSLINLNHYPLNHHPVTVFGVLEAESNARLRGFFSKLRSRK